MPGAVRRVQIHHHVGIPSCIYISEHGLHFGRLCLDRVSIEIEALAVRAHTNHRRSILLRTIFLYRPKLLVPIDVINGIDKNDNFLEQTSLAILAQFS